MRRGGLSEFRNQENGRSQQAYFSREAVAIACGDASGPGVHSHGRQFVQVPRATVH